MGTRLGFLSSVFVVIIIIYTTVFFNKNMTMMSIKNNRGVLLQSTVVMTDYENTLKVSKELNSTKSAKVGNLAYRLIYSFKESNYKNVTENLEFYNSSVFSNKIVMGCAEIPHMTKKYDENLKTNVNILDSTVSTNPGYSLFIKSDNVYIPVNSYTLISNTTEFMLTSKTDYLTFSINKTIGTFVSPYITSRLDGQILHLTLKPNTYVVFNYENNKQDIIDYNSLAPSLTSETAERKATYFLYQNPNNLKIINKKEISRDYDVNLLVKQNNKTVINKIIPRTVLN